ncbi:MAG: hypothetical protein JRN24_02400 [Nitrososphaerota archaeon]|nr:hypothetical protein [Nitrososphaerota archaeon]
MKYAIAGIVAVLIAAVFVLAAVPTSSLGKTLGLSAASDHQPSGEKDKQAKANDTDDNETEDNETGESEMTNATLIAGGGGWSMVNVSGTLYRDTFGVFVDGDSGNWSYSSLVFQARDQGAMIHATNFTDIVFDNTTVANVTYVRASGWATWNQEQGFWFKLVLMDNGSRSNDSFDLAIYKDANNNWTMDETTPLAHWVFNGLGGGNIWVSNEDMESED